MLDRGMGLLRHGADGEFTVADLTQRDYHDVELCVLHHAPPRPGDSGSRIGLDHQWSVRPMRVPPGMEAAGLDLFSFDSDAVVPVGGRFLAWVDYYQGMLLVDVLHEDAELRFVPMPAEALLSRRWYYDEGIPDPVRCVGVTDGDIVKLVCIITPDRRSPAFTIATWTLADIDRGVWDKDGTTTMDDSQFFGLCCGVTAKISRQPPSFPMVSLVDPDVVCFLLEEEHGVVWMVEVNMRTKVLLSRAVYLDEEEARRNPFDGLRNFISYLSTTSNNL
ncbi:hypothetical protein C2845_PM17G15030 [Panicum miliaceum]|uniref:DUF1618 domain-containing protein n=1 Tax=Panicum miliaceum TaxID=4540 RepID=A0A3L6Q2W8_PANMI|nr:hypothetical protein C2845_PM17G15030 [Panicum miliaceum]